MKKIISDKGFQFKQKRSEDFHCDIHTHAHTPLICAACQFALRFTWIYGLLSRCPFLWIQKADCNNWPEPEMTVGDVFFLFFSPPSSCSRIGSCGFVIEHNLWIIFSKASCWSLKMLCINSPNFTLDWIYKRPVSVTCYPLTSTGYSCEYLFIEKPSDFHARRVRPSHSSEHQVSKKDSNLTNCFTLFLKPQIC